jgi:hypothetical protein
MNYSPPPFHQFLQISSHDIKVACLSTILLHYFAFILSSEFCSPGTLRCLTRQLFPDISKQRSRPTFIKGSRAPPHGMVYIQSYVSHTYWQRKAMLLKGELHQPRAYIAK